MKLKIQLTEKDFQVASWLILRPSPTFKFAGAFLLLVFGGVTIGGIVEGIHGKIEQPLVWVFIGEVYFVFVFFFLRPRNIRNAFRRTKAMQRPYELEIDDTGIASRSELDSSLLPWDEVIKWKRNRAMFAYFRSEAFANILPVRAFDSPADEQAFENLLRSKVGPPKS